MINAVVYNSLTGSCEKYAKLISAALHVPAVAMGEHVRSDGKVIYIGWARAGSIYGYAAAAKKYNIAAAVLVSMSPAGEKNIAAARKADKIGPEIAVFNVQGAFHMDKLPAPSPDDPIGSCRKSIHSFQWLDPKDGYLLTREDQIELLKFYFLPELL